MDRPKSAKKASKAKAKARPQPAGEPLPEPLSPTMVKAHYIGIFVTFLVVLVGLAGVMVLLGARLRLRRRRVLREPPLRVPLLRSQPSILPCRRGKGREVVQSDQVCRAVEVVHGEEPVHDHR